MTGSVECELIYFTAEMGCNGEFVLITAECRASYLNRRAPLLHYAISCNVGVCV